MGETAKIFGRKSRFLVSGPGIGEMSVTRRDSLRFSGIPGRVLSAWYQSHSAVWCECADQDVGPLRGVDCKIPHQPTERG
ncbi:Putative disease resistance TIR-NBS-LRR class protein [Prunus dulcis]|uniref:Disease resistance TIR-NBS-LRR class protein n=1 Tax=Prunus dulcis TaxID=3755 RepID=A0A5H2Y3L4_PRUDU|nr:Putative disease resistance TIR-NBS-LRR class protein [Prunus dulcis]